MLKLIYSVTSKHMPLDLYFPLKKIGEFEVKAFYLHSFLKI